jgi:ubiquinone/menaquinone biosynthesis C-methylase UbiE
MEVQPSDRVLEIGFGPGIAVREIARRATRGEVVGIDHSAVMRAQAARRNAAAIREGRVALIVASVEDLPTLDGNSTRSWPSTTPDYGLSPHSG